METVRIRDPGWKKVGSGIRDKHPGSATLNFSDGFGSQINFFWYFYLFIPVLQVFDSILRDTTFLGVFWTLILSNCQEVLFQIHFGYGAAWNRNDFFRIRILLKVLAPTRSGSGSTTLVVRTEVKTSHYNITLRFYYSMCNNNNMKSLR
jgi:hypothetical protein